MTCKHLGTQRVPKPPETDDSGAPQFIEMPACALGRDPGTIGWAGKCRKTPSEGPCWWWEKTHRDREDVRF
jgi:hypothetical protein